MQNQPSLFDQKSESGNDENIALFALGDFQSRDKLLIDRELPLERLLGAFRRAFEHFGCDEFTDERIAEVLGKLGATVVEVPDFVAKHPFRITIPEATAQRAEAIYAELRE